MSLRRKSRGVKSFDSVTRCCHLQRCWLSEAQSLQVGPLVVDGLLVMEYALEENNQTRTFFFSLWFSAVVGDLLLPTVPTMMFCFAAGLKMTVSK